VPGASFVRTAAAGCGRHATIDASPASAHREAVVTEDFGRQRFAVLARGGRVHREKGGVPLAASGRDSAPPPLAQPSLDSTKRPLWPVSRSQNGARLADGLSGHPGPVEPHTPSTAIMNYADRPKLGTLAMTFEERRFVLDLYPWPAHFTAIGAVFALTRVTGTPRNSPEHQVVYVQETDNLSFLHWDFGCMLAGLFDCVGVIPVASESVRHRVEAELRCRLDPPCNRCLASGAKASAPASRCEVVSRDQEPASA
jgi:hypothetical protein